MKLTRRQLKKTIRMILESGESADFKSQTEKYDYPIYDLFTKYSWVTAQTDFAIKSVAWEYSDDIAMVRPKDIRDSDRLYLGVKDPAIDSDASKSYETAGAYRFALSELHSLEYSPNQKISSRRIKLPFGLMVKQLMNQYAWMYTDSTAEPWQAHPEGKGYMAPIEWSIYYEATHNQYKRILAMLLKLEKVYGLESPEAAVFAYQQGYKRSQEGVFDLMNDIKKFIPSTNLEIAKR